MTTKTKKNNKITVVTEGHLIIDDKYVKKLVPTEYKKFADAFDKASFDGPDDYEVAIDNANSLVYYDNYPKSIELSENIESIHFDENTEAVSKALAKLMVAAFKKGVDLAIGYVYNDCESDIKFSLDSSVIQVTLTDAGQKMLKKLGISGNIRLTDLNT